MVGALKSDPAKFYEQNRLDEPLLGAWLIAAPWFLSGATAAAKWYDVAVGLLVIVLSLPKGPVRERYAGWDRLIA